MAKHRRVDFSIELLPATLRALRARVSFRGNGPAPSRPLLQLSGIAAGNRIGGERGSAWLMSNGFNVSQTTNTPLLRFSARLAVTAALQNAWSEPQQVELEMALVYT